MTRGTSGPASALIRADWIAPVASAPIAKGAVLIRDGVIEAVGPARSVTPPPGTPEIDLGDVILIPGLIDAHCHLEWALTSGVAPAAPFAQWLGAFVGQSQQFDMSHRERATRWGALMAQVNGTTTMMDVGPTGAGSAALTDSGMRGTVHLEIFGRERGRDALERAIHHAEAVAQLRDSAGPGVQIGVSPHAPYTVGPDLWTALLEHPDLGAAPFTTHLAESPDEVRLLDEGDGPLGAMFKRIGRVPGQWPGGAKGPVGRLAAHDVLRPGLIAAHCVQVNEMDAMTLAALDVRVAHCPQSNARLHCGDAPVAMLHEVGVPVGLGTDSPASAGAYDLRAEARAAGEAAARRGAPISAVDMLALATTGSARVIGREHDLGAIAPGMRADLVAVQPFDVSMAQFDTAAAVLDQRSRVTWVMIDGQVLIEGGYHARMDAEGVIADARQARAQMGLD